MAWFDFVQSFCMWDRKMASMHVDLVDANELASVDALKTIPNTFICIIIVKAEYWQDGSYTQLAHALMLIYILVIRSENTYRKSLDSLWSRSSGNIAMCRSIKYLEA